MAPPIVFELSFRLTRVYARANLNYFVFLVLLAAWVSADAATILTFAGVLGLASRPPAIEATFLDVVSLEWRLVVIFAVIMFSRIKNSKPCIRQFWLA